MTIRLTTLRAGLAAFATLTLAVNAEAACFRGINLSGAEFGDRHGRYGQQYTYPSKGIVSHFAVKGMRAVRLPFLWERLQPKLMQPLDADEFGRLRQAVGLIRAAGMDVILDPHNYALYDGRQVGSSAVPNEAFADFWSRLAAEFANREGVSFGLMNEPHDLAADRWLASANAAIAAIRGTGAKNLILVPGTNWTGAHSWAASNAATMIKVADPAGNFAFEVHQYLDGNFSGTHPECDGADAAVKAIDDMTAWLRANHARGYLGEFGAGKSPQCLNGISAIVDRVNAAKDVWTGWTYWVAGDWWGEDEPLNITPTASGDKAQMNALLRPGLSDTACGGL